MKIILIALALAGTAYLALCIHLYLAQRSFIYFPQPRYGTTVPIVRLKNADADLVVSAKAAQGTRAVIYFGGNAEDVSLTIEPLSQAYGDAAIYAMHYRGYGGSTGVPTERDLVADGIVLFDNIRQRHPEVTIVGRSLGSGIAIQVASLRPASRLVLVTPYDSIAELAAQQFYYVPVRWLLKDTYNSREYAPKIAVPTIVISAENDEIIPASSTERLLTRFKKGIVTAYVMKGAGHNDISEHPDYNTALRHSALLQP